MTPNSFWFVTESDMFVPVLGKYNDGRLPVSTAWSTTMGYDLHITRRKDWSAKGNDISADEWLAYVEKDRELSLWPTNGRHVARWNGKGKHPDLWLDWFHGNIFSKNPEAALIDKMVQIADALGAHVQGDDGEIYRNGRDGLIHPDPSTFGRLMNWLRALRPTPRVKPVKRPFEVGDRVLDAYGKVATVVQIDPESITILEE